MRAKRTRRYCADWTFYSIPLRFVDRFISSRGLQNRRIGNVPCDRPEALEKTEKCVGRCLSLKTVFVDSSVAKISEVHTCEEYHLNQYVRKLGVHRGSLLRANLQRKIAETLLLQGGLL
ncbi:hypothetical protein L596_015639 [Steinernema carpocapsae]|uniref:Uncharacterized protein n=1 Tax=Steinernema carpocapsae TaxID=34508 RepID=A0A4U5NGF5_STECR|nr:hypothetical protein L596_015639 [Steinernema carpocapsae]